MKPAGRISSIESYFFSSLGKRIVEMRAAGRDVIRIDMGSPDLPPPQFIIEVLSQSARRADMHGYTLGGGTVAFRAAVSAHYRRRFGVDLDPKTEVLDLLGSKEGLFMLSQVLLDPGDLALLPDPAYSVYDSGARIAGAEVYALPLLAKNSFLPDLTAIPKEIARRAKILWLNYPNNPTGATAPFEFFLEVIDFARQFDLLVAHDAPYTEVTFDGYVAPSLLQVDGAKEVAVEFNSLSKAFNMAGWRLGMAVGNPDVIKYMETYKGQKDSAHFGPVYAAGIAALEGDQGWLEERNNLYKERRDLVLAGLEKVELHADTPSAALYVWARIPADASSEDFCARMLEEINVSTTPGSVFGAHGEGYFRISLVTPSERIQEAMDRIVEWMKVKV